MPDANVGDLTRQAIEELFEGRNDRDYARLFMEEGLTRLQTEWKGYLDLDAAYTVTATEDGFRVVFVANRNYSVVRPEARKLFIPPTLDEELEAETDTPDEFEN